MQNMGLHRLALVAPARFPHPEARMMACHADSLLQQACIYASFQAAIASCHWLIGTSARQRHYRLPPITPRELACKLPDLCQSKQVGIVFGPEDTGLSSAELDLCHEFVAIPTVPEATSLNLAQAVMVICYEILQARAQPPSRRQMPLATVAELEAMYAHLQQALAIRGFADLAAVERIIDRLRRILARAALEKRDVRLLRGIARQLGWALRHPPTPPSG
jgi:TrmH family RNA methyltransferase